MSATMKLESLFENIVLLATITSWCLAQLLKVLLFILFHRSNRVREAVTTVFWRTGGMPSSHSAVVCALVTSIAFVEGISSNLFIFSFWFTMIVLRDALGVRRAAGLQAKALNYLGKQFTEKNGVDFKAVKEVQGHTPLEVAVGAFLGIFVAVGFSLFRV
jgi:acid phosphatase family membrane protein YuiD